MKHVAMTLVERLDRVPPCLVRLLARKANGRQLMTTEDIAKKSGICKTIVAEMSLRTSWAGLEVDKIQAFAKACGVNPLRPCEVREYLKKSGRMHLTRATRNQKRMILRIYQLKPTGR